MIESFEAPGVALVLLKRGKTSTDVLVFSRSEQSERLPCNGARPGTTQWELAESLCETSWANEVSRLYASTLSVRSGGDRLGVFVGFLDGDASDAPLPPHAEWVGLREAARALPAPWAETVGRVREHFVARSPDEALRVR